MFRVAKLFCVSIYCKGLYFMKCPKLFETDDTQKELNWG